MHPPHNDHFAWMVPTFVVINIGLFALALYINDCPSHSTDCVAQDLLGRFAFQSLRENPLLGPSASTLQLMGALEVKKVVEEHEVWRLLSCSWLHAGVLHVLANMVSLLFVGIRLEEEFGFVRIGLLYIISGLGGSLLSALFIRTTISVGASGALFGLLGGMLAELLTNWTIYTNKLAALLTLILIIAINLAVGILPHVDNFAHVGGFVTGFFLGFVLTAGLVLLLSGVDGNNYCSWCHHLRCVPTPFWKCNSEQVYCESNISGNQLNLKCLSNRKSKLYTLEGAWALNSEEHELKLQNEDKNHRANGELSFSYGDEDEEE
ncbi:RHOMBOID-like protein 1 [Camellia lanceoleosa]|uniref:RHOMBOID-like protein 1 n=1 Tax=Camellia lanceoleosa TaxID=1840588 RepID=A0ACC0F2E2_9ERIC|nr:RHOMBOID-like protein 1 [Camellia lanceoleosa]